MFAEIPNWNLFGALAVAVLFCLIFAEKVQSVFFRRPQRREVSFPDEAASKKELSDLKAAVEREKEYGAQRREAIYAMIKETKEHTDAKFDQVRREIKDDVDGVHGRVSELVEAVGELRGEIRQALKK